MRYDKEEKSVIDAYEKDMLQLVSPSKMEIEEIKRTARNTLTKDKRITIRLYDHDFKGIQKKTLEMGIPYHALISGIIHQFVEGELVSKIR